MRRGFTLIEILVVIAIIGVLSSVVLSSLNTARAKSRDAQRASDARQIFTALNLFYDTYGCLPTTSGSGCISGYSESNAGTWDYSSQGGYLGFLSASGVMKTVPVDPLNNMTGDASPANTYSYRYFCYTGGANQGLHMGYWKEYPSWQYVQVNQSGSFGDPQFTCK